MDTSENLKNISHKCVVCHINEANQKHHVSYKPELIINICKSCHQVIHKNHGVGAGEGEHESKIKETHPFFTYFSSKGVRDSETDEILNQLACKCGYNRFSIFFRENKTACYLLCNGCGQDWKVATLAQKEDKQTLLEEANL
jgi:hypothetical protein